MLYMAAKMAKAVSAVSSAKLPGSNDDGPKSHDNTAEAQEDTNPKEDTDKQGSYDPHVPGKILFMHRWVSAVVWRACE